MSLTVTDADGRALREDGSVIDGLFAAGNASASVMGHTYPGPGSTIGPATVVIIAEHKRRSPSAGVLREGASVSAIAVAQDRVVRSTRPSWRSAPPNPGRRGASGLSACRG